MRRGPRAVVAFAMTLFCAGESLVAAPLLDDPVAAADGTLLFADSRQADVFYYPPLGLRLGTANGAPQFVLFKSVGMAEDGGGVAGGGIVGLTLERLDPDEAQRRAWQRALPRPATLRPLPAESVRWRLLLTAADAEAAEVLAERQVPWQRKSVSFALGTETTTLLWSALELAGNLALVADVEIRARGYMRQPRAEGGHTYEESERVDRLSVPLDVSRQEHPSLFSVIHRADRQRFSYRRLTVFCFDFAEPAGEALARVQVDVRLISPRGQIERHALAFSPDDDPMQTIDFRLPARPDHPAHYRVTRIDVAGSRRATPWKEIDHEHLDVTVYEIEITDHG